MSCCVYACRNNRAELDGCKVWRPVWAWCPFVWLEILKSWWTTPFIILCRQQIGSNTCSNEQNFQILLGAHTIAHVPWCIDWFRTKHIDLLSVWSCRTSDSRVAGCRVAGCRVAGCRVAGCREFGWIGWIRGLASLLPVSQISRGI